MTRRVLLALALSLTLLIGGTSPSPLQRADIQRDLSSLTKRGFTYLMLDNDMIKLTDPLSGEKQLKTMQETSEAQIRSWAAQRGIPVLEIDPTTVDTGRYADWYIPAGQIALSNEWGNPLIIGDLDRNNNAEVYGVSRTGSDFESQIYEIDTLNASRFLYRYDSLPGISRYVGYIDSDSLMDVAFSKLGVVSVYEQPSVGTLPVQLSFRHERYQGNLDPGYAGIYFGSLDGDSLNDFLYKGSECDSIDTTNCITKIYVAEYNRQVNNFERVWSTDFDLKGNVSGVGGFAVDDFDGDGKQEFVSVDLLSRRVFIVENVSDNSFAWTWQDSTPFANLYYTTSGDVDHDGKPEFFVGATSNGSWTTMYEADSNNHYSARFIIHLLSGGLFDFPTYLTTDVDGDGILELAIMSGNILYIFKSREDDRYYLWYMKREDRKDAVQFYDFNHDGRQDFIISKFGVDSLGRGMNYADYYRATSLVSVKEPQVAPCQFALDQNYPNPFNPKTTITYVVAAHEVVALRMYNLLGQNVATLVSGEESPGRHHVTWDAAGMASGIYFCRLAITDRVLTIKLLLLR